MVDCNSDFPMCTKSEQIQVETHKTGMENALHQSDRGKKEQKKM